MRALVLGAHARRLIVHTPVRLGVFLLIALFARAAAFPLAAGINDFHDAEFLSAYERHALLAVTHHGQLPLWDPYSCGGMYGLSAPQTRFASPFFLLTLLFGVDRAAVLLFVLLPAIGMEGMYRYARRWGALALPAFAWAPAFPLCGFFALSFQFGWVQFLSFCLVPWILYGLRGALRGDPRAALLCAVAVAIAMGFGGTYTLPMTMVLALAELLDAVLPRLTLLVRGRASVASGARRLRRTGAALAVLLPLVLGVAAYRLWPMLESIEATMRTMGGQPAFTADALANLLFVPARAGSEDLGHFHVSPAFALLALAAPLRGRLALWLGAVLSLALAFGHAHPLAPFSLLRQLPLYDTLRYPERYLLLFVLGVSLLGALGGTRLLALARRFGRRRLAGPVAAALAVLALVGVASTRENTRWLLDPVRLEPTPVVQQAEFRQSRGNRWLMSHFAAEGMGSLACGEAYPVPMSSRLRGDLRAEEYLVGLDGGAPPTGSLAARAAWSPNRVEVQVDARGPVRLALNQNHHPGWHSDLGEVASWDGLLSVTLPAGVQRVVLRFLPRSGIGGIAASVLALLGGALYVLRRPRSRALRALALGAGPLIVALLLLVWPEAPWRRAPPRTETGQPVLLSALPAEATPLSVRFDVPLALEGVRLPAAPLPGGSDEVPLELFFRRTGALSASLGIFMHLSGPRGEERGDHATLSSVVYLPRLPLDTLGRDALRVPLTPDAAGLWTVRMGLWDAYGGGTRHHVVDAGGAPVDNDSVVVGQFVVAPAESKAAAAARQ